MNLERRARIALEQAFDAKRVSAEQVLALIANPGLITRAVVAKDRLELIDLETTIVDIAPDGALCKVERTDDLDTLSVDGVVTFKGRVHRLRSLPVPCYFARSLDDGAIGLIVVFGKGKAFMNNEPLKELRATDSLEYFIGATDSGDVVLRVAGGGIFERWREERVHRVFRAGEVLLTESAGQRFLRAPRLGEWRLPDCEVLDARLFAKAIGVLLRNSWGDTRVIWKFQEEGEITQTDVDFVGGMSGYGKGQVTCASGLREQISADGDTFGFLDGRCLVTVTGTTDRHEKHWSATVEDVRHFPYLVSWMNGEDYVVERYDSALHKTIKLADFRRQPTLERAAGTIVAMAQSQRSCVLRWGEELEHEVSGDWCAVDLTHAVALTNRDFHKLVLPVQTKKDGRWEIADGVTTYGPTFNSIIRMLPTADGKGVRVWGMDGKAVMRITAMMFT